jgi:cation diffusion facilitator CzcD-associated flavoprotein CzcO
MTLNGNLSVGLSTGPAQDPGYQIPNAPIDSPKNRKVKVLGIGAGASGIMMAYKIQKFCDNVDFKILEKNQDIGGTWLENRYPNCACDIPSHAYSFKWALNPDWPKFFSQAPDIWEYLDRVCKTFNLRQYMAFNSKVTSCRWDAESGKWIVKYERTVDGTVLNLEETCDVLLHATGVLNRPKWPQIGGLDKFKGKVSLTQTHTQELLSYVYINL